MIGFNTGYRRLYTRHGKKYFKAYRNYWSGNDDELDQLVDEGLLGMVEGKDGYRIYWLTPKGIEWLGNEIGVIIKVDT